MKKTILIFLIFFISFGVRAADYEGNPYFIKNNFVTSGGKNPSDARKKAISKAQRDAFSILLDRLLIDDAFNDDISSEEISDAVHSQQITNEKIAGSNYSAIFNIAFSESFVNQILSDKNIDKDAVKKETYLIFPTKISGNKSLLWESSNDWMLSVDSILKNSESDINIKLPNGDVDDIATINSKTINNANFSDFEPMLTKYNTDTVIICAFDFDKIENKVVIYLKTIRKFQKKQIKLDFINVNHLEYSELLNKVAQKTIEHIASQKQPNNNKDEKDTTIKVDVLISSLEEWLSIQSTLENLEFIKEMKVNSISKDIVKINIKHHKDSNIISLFNSFDFMMMQKGQNQYFLYK